MRLTGIHPLYRIRAKLIVSFVGVCLLVGLLSLIVGIVLINSAVLGEATSRISQDLNAAAEIYASEVRLIETIVGSVAADAAFATALERLDLPLLHASLGRLDAMPTVDFSGIAFPAEAPHRQQLESALPPEVTVRSTDDAGFLRLCFESRVAIAGSFAVDQGFLEGEDPSLGARARIPITGGGSVFDGMSLVAAAPLFDRSGIVAIVYAGRLLNRDEDLVDRIRDALFRDESPSTVVGTATIFYGNTRIATNVRGEGGERAVGTRVSAEVEEQVLDRGERWSDRAYVVNAWYRTAYEPIESPSGERIGMLYVGVPDAKYVAIRRRTLALFVGITTSGVVLAVLLGYLIGRLILDPVTRLIEASDRVREGDFDPDIGPIAHDELGLLQRTFLTMLTSLEERAARQAEESETKLRLSEKQASVGRLAAGVAHEINNPLTSVLTFTHLLLERGDLPGDARADLAIIAQSTERVRTIVRDLLGFAREVELHPTPTDMRELVSDAVRLVKNQAAARRLSLNASFSDTLPLKTLDPGQMQSVLINLLLNAIDATGPGGSIEVSVRLAPSSHVDRDRASGHPGFEISVTDSGHGIAPADLERIFDPFFTTKPAGSGTGLGLAVSLAIVEGHGGDIRVTSEPGKGSTFTVLIPADA